MKPPPWIQTKTGYGPLPAGAQMLRYKQSSLRATPASAFCMASAANFVASCTPEEDVSATGGRKRSLPTGGSAKGMPRKTRTPCSVVP